MESSLPEFRSGGFSGHLACLSLFAAMAKFSRAGKSPGYSLVSIISSIISSNDGNGGLK